MFFPTGAAVFLGSLFPNHTPSPADALVSPFSVQDTSVKAVTSRGASSGWFRELSFWVGEDSEVLLVYCIDVYGITYIYTSYRCRIELIEREVLHGLGGVD